MRSALGRRSMPVFARVATIAARRIFTRPLRCFATDKKSPRPFSLILSFKKRTEAFFVRMWAQRRWRRVVHSCRGRRRRSRTRQIGAAVGAELIEFGDFALAVRTGRLQVAFAVGAG